MCLISMDPAASSIQFGNEEMASFEMAEASQQFQFLDTEIVYIQQPHQSSQLNENSASNHINEFEHQLDLFLNEISSGCVDHLSSSGSSLINDQEEDLLNLITAGIESHQQQQMDQLLQDNSVLIIMAEIEQQLVDEEVTTPKSPLGKSDKLADEIGTFDFDIQQVLGEDFFNSTNSDSPLQHSEDEATYLDLNILDMAASQLMNSDTKKRKLDESSDEDEDSSGDDFLLLSPPPSSSMASEDTSSLSNGSAKRRRTSTKGESGNKKDSNRSAAKKYREKKQLEKDELFKKRDVLAKRNVEMRKSIEDIQLEISYIKSLLVEALIAKNNTS
jgi:hypothetical protein